MFFSGPIFGAPRGEYWDDLVELELCSTITYPDIRGEKTLISSVFL